LWPPRIAGVGVAVGITRCIEARNCDAVRLDVVGVAVATVFVVGDDGLRAHFTYDFDKFADGLIEVGLPEALGTVVAGFAHHSGITPPARTAEEAMVGDAERVHGVGQLTNAVLAEPILLVRGEMAQLGDKDFTFFAER